ncbi:putative metabolite transport protein YwtG [Colletotrichum spinosum]|uniref:Putative metabolite transport protein YwtG n=1 Tax=Colletotrichum spinosum TaxID=1347390 RepID=A0A4R8Q9S2_9PEZI|nr:putative metabolite transport protein YwtG [Colletotrichum spinosum]
MARNKLMPNYVTASVGLSFGGFLTGFDSGCIGSIVHMEQFSAALGPMSATVTGITVSTILLTSIVPALFAGQLADKYGRLRIMLPGTIVFGAGLLLQATASTLAQFVIGRAVSGLGQGAFLPSMSVYISEIAPARSRGRLASLPQFVATLGLCLGYFSCFATSFVQSDMAWRAPYIVQLGVVALLAVACWSLYESPRWLLQHGRVAEATKALASLDMDMDEARRDFLNAPQEEPSLSRREGFLLPFRGPYRSRTLLALFFLSMIQLSGIDALVYYAPALFAQAGISQSSSSLVASGVSSIAMLIVSIPAFIMADKWSRRTSAISGGACLSAIMALIGSLYASGTVGSVAGVRWVVIVSVVVFGMVYCATWNIVAKIYAAEIQPGNTRAAGNSIGMASSFFTNWLVALITPILLSASTYGAYYLFGGLTVMTSVVLAVYMPETRGQSLESIQSEFRKPVLVGLLGALCNPTARRATTEQNAGQSVELATVAGPST